VSGVRAALYFVPPVICLVWPLPMLPVAILPSSTPPPIPLWPIAVGWSAGLLAIPGYRQAFSNSLLPAPDAILAKRSFGLVTSLICGFVASLIGTFYFGYFFGPALVLPSVCGLCCLNLLRYAAPRRVHAGGA
jgi:hypothetical protein